MASLIAVGGSRLDSLSVRIYDDTGSGTPSMSKDTGGTVYGVCFDPDASVYATGASGTSAVTYAWDSGGTQIFTDTISLGSAGKGIAADDSGYSYVGFQYSNSLVKYDSSGSKSWTKTELNRCGAVSRSPSGLIYAVGNPSASLRNIYCYDASGTVQWYYDEFESGVELTGVAAVDDEFIYVVGPRTSNKSLWKLQHSGGSTSVVWSKDHGAGLSCCAVTPDGGVVVGGTVSSSVSIRQYSASGTQEWTADHGATVRGIACDSGGNVYIAGTRTSSLTCRKYDSSGSLQYSWDVGTTAYCIALWSPGALSTEAPGIPIELSLALPSVGFSISPPAIPLGIALAVPAVTVSTPPDLAEAVGYSQIVYRLYLVTEDLYELPLAEIVCRRRLGASTWLVCQVPSVNDDIVAACLAHIGGELSIYSGITDEAGNEQLGEFLRSVLTDVDESWASGTRTLTLTGRVQNPSYTSAERTLLAVETRGSDAGRRRAVCAVVDPLLKPNDTVDDGEETWIAGSIDYRITSSTATMTVIEALDG